MNRVLRIFIGLLAMALVFGCSGSGSNTAYKSSGTVIGSEIMPNGKLKLAKLEGGTDGFMISPLVWTTFPVGAPKDQQNPHTIYLSNRNLYFVVWEDLRNESTTGSDIYGQFLHDDGTPCGYSFPVINAAGNQTAPYSAYRNGDNVGDAGHDMLTVVWQDGANIKYRALTWSTFPTSGTCPNSATVPTLSWTTIKTPSATSIEGWNAEIITTWHSVSSNIGIGDGSKTNFTATLQSPVQVGSVTVYGGNGWSSFSGPISNMTLDDNSAGGFTGDGFGSINYGTGALSATFIAPPNGGNIVSASYNYATYSIHAWTTSIHDTVSARTKPKVTYDPSRDNFWVGWNESRSIQNSISELCFGMVPASWSFGVQDSQFPAYVAIDASSASLNEMPSGIGTAKADLLRNGTTRTNRLISSSGSALTETYVYEYFSGENNIMTSADTTGPETLYAWEGARQKATMTCTCTDKNSNGSCDIGEPVTSTLTTTAYDDGLVHIYSLFDDEIKLAALGSKKLDTSTAGAYYPAIGFDPATKKFLTAWEDLRDGSNTKIYGQLLYSGGGLYNNNFIISFSDSATPGVQDTNVANSKQTKPYIGYDPANQRFFVIWQDGRNGTVSLENLDIYGQYVDAEGSLRGSNYAISTNPYNQWNPTISYDTNVYQFLAVWKDARNANTSASDIWGQRFSLGQPQLTLLKIDDTPLSPSLLNFGFVTVGQYITQSFKIRNTGDTTLNISCVLPSSFSTPFGFSSLPSQLNSCSDANYITLVPSAEITLTVQFAPLAGATPQLGPYSDSFTIKSDAGDSIVYLQGTGVSTSLGVLGLDSSNALDFGSIKPNQTEDMNFTIINNGSTTFKVQSISGFSSAFSMISAPTFPVTLAPSQTQIITVRFAPTERGTYDIQTLISTDQPGVTKTVELKGKAVAPILRVDPINIGFGSVQAWSTLTHSFTIYNDGDDTMHVNSCGTYPSGFTLSSPCPTTLGWGSNQAVNVAFKPTDIVDYSGTITVKTDGGNQDVTLSGTGTGGKISLSTNVVDFGTVSQGAKRTVNVRVTNIGTAPCHLTNISNPAFPFSVPSWGSISVQLLAGTSYTIPITYWSTISGISNSHVTVSSDAVNGDQTVDLQGQLGTQPPGGGGSVGGGGGGGGCSVGGRQNGPNAFANMAVMLSPIFAMILVRNIRRRRK